MFWWLDRWNLTPDQVRALPIRDQVRLPMIADLVDEVRAEKDKAAARR